jgi:hypothetical protein
MATVSVSVRANAEGNFQTSVRLTASNDDNPVNDAQEVALQISAANSADDVSPAKGGGGRFEWLALALLGGLVTFRACRSWKQRPGGFRPQTTMAH